MEDEAPMFDDPVFSAADLENDAAETDALEADPATRQLFDTAGAVRHRVVVLWGELPPDRTRDHVRDWTGRLALSRGGMLVRRRIGFEEATDRLLPRSDRLVVDVQSITRPFADGLVLEVVDATPSSTDPLVLSYNGAAGAQTFDLAALRDGPIVRDMGEEDRMVVIALRDGDPCDHGFMRGRWHQIRPGL